MEREILTGRMVEKAKRRQCKNGWVTRWEVGVNEKSVELIERGCNSWGGLDYHIMMFGYNLLAEVEAGDVISVHLYELGEGRVTNTWERF